MTAATDIIKRGLNAFQTRTASQTLGLSGLGTATSEQMQDEVEDRRKGVTPSPGLQKSYGSGILSASARDLLG